jgi:hypothetical protein
MVKAERWHGKRFPPPTIDGLGNMLQILDKDPGEYSAKRKKRKPA